MKKPPRPAHIEIPHCGTMSDPPKAEGSGASPCSAITDTERLDWMQRTKETVWRVSHDERRPLTDGTNNTELVSVFEGWTVDDPENPKPTIREAIDHFILSQNAGEARR